LAFLAPFGGLGTTYDVHLGFTGKRLVDFPLVLIELFFARCYGWGATSENISKIGDFAPTRSVWPKISGRSGRPTPIIFAHIVRPWMPYNFVADSFHTNQLCSRLFRANCDLHGKRPFCVL